MNAAESVIGPKSNKSVGREPSCEMKLQANETEVLGKWVALNGKVQGDSTCERIEWLVTKHLLRIDNSKEWGDWETLFQDPDNGRFWERTYPQGNMQGGGPPRLCVLSADQAKVKYGLN